MTLFNIVLLFAAGFLASAVNAIAGGGTFLTFGALTLITGIDYFRKAIPYLREVR